MARKVNEIVSAGIAQKMSLQGGEGFHMHPPADETRNGFMTVEDRKTMNGATPSPTPNTLMKRNSSGRAKVSEPLESDDIARKKEVDNVGDSIVKHIASSTAHPAQNISYSGDIVGATNVKQALDKTKQTIDDLILGSGDSGPEVAAARGGYETLGDRLDDNDLKVNKIDQPLVGRYKTVKEDDQYNCWPVIVRRGDNRLIAFYASGPIHKPGYSLGRKVACKYSDNNGLSWSDENVIAYDPEYDFFIYSALVLNSGAVLCILTKSKPGFQTHVVYRSTDGGATYSEVFDFRDSTDIYIKASWSPNLMVQFETGRIMSIKDCHIDGNYGSYAIFSDDDGLTWNASAAVVPMGTLPRNSFPWEVRSTYLGNGKIMSIGRNTSGNLYQLTSGDYGLTWKYSLTNISDCIDHNACPVFLSNNSIALYYTDRRSNTIKKRVVDADFIFTRPTSWPQSEIIGYTSSIATAIDGGYVVAIPITLNSLDVVGVMYTVRKGVSNNDTDVRHSAIVNFFDRTNYSNQHYSLDGLNRQALINGGFDIWQRGNSFNATGYSADRWRFTPGTGNTCTVERMNATKERKYLPNNITNVAVINRTEVGTGSTFFAQRLEDVNTFADEYISFSFYAKSESGLLPISVYGFQNFGSGGSASASSEAKGFQVRDEWVKYEGTIKIPSVEGKTIGVNSFLEFAISILASGGVNKLYLSQVQVNSGRIPLPYTPRHIAEEKKLCERYCISYTEESINNTIANGFAVSTEQVQAIIHLPTEMRVIPTLTATAADFQLNDGVSSIDVTTLGTLPSRSSKRNLSLSCIATGLTQFRPYRLMADGSGYRTFILDAEL